MKINFKNLLTEETLFTNKKSPLQEDWHTGIVTYNLSLEDAQEMVDSQLAHFGRVGGGLLDDLDQAGYYIDSENIVRKKVNESVEEKIDLVQEITNDSDATKYISRKGKICYRIFAPLQWYFLKCKQAGLEPKQTDDFVWEAKGPNFKFDWVEEDAVLALDKESITEDIEENEFKIGECVKLNKVPGSASLYNQWCIITDKIGDKYQGYLEKDIKEENYEDTLIEFSDDDIKWKITKDYLGEDRYMQEVQPLIDSVAAYLSDDALDEALKQNDQGQPTAQVDAEIDKIQKELNEDFEPFFFSNEDGDYFREEAQRYIEELEVTDYMDEYDSFRDFVDNEFSVKVLGAWGSTQEMDELFKYYCQEAPKQVKIGERIFKESLINESAEGPFEIYTIETLKKKDSEGNPIKKETTIAVVDTYEKAMEIYNEQKRKGKQVKIETVAKETLEESKSINKSLNEGRADIYNELEDEYFQALNKAEENGVVTFIVKENEDDEDYQEFETFEEAKEYAKEHNLDKIYVSAFAVCNGYYCDGDYDEYDEQVLDLDRNIVESLNESIDEDQYFEKLKPEIKEIAEGDWEVGHAFDPDDFRLFARMIIEGEPELGGYDEEEDDFVIKYPDLMHRLFDYYYECIDEVKSEAYYDLDEKLIQGKSDKTLKKNIATEIKAGKDPKQAYAIAKSIQKKNMNENFSLK